MSTAGLSKDRKQYRRRLKEQPDEQIDAWMIEFMRDMSIRRGVLTVLEEYRAALAADPNLARAHRALGRALHKAGERDLARQHLERYLFLDPGAKDRAYIERELEELRP